MSIGEIEQGHSSSNEVNDMRIWELVLGYLKDIWEVRTMRVK
jgi:hypothetical protein